MATSHDRIIPTAWLIAHRRSFSDIPFAKEMLAALDKIKSERFPDITDEMLATERAPQFEARYKLIDRLIAEQGIPRVLEIAAGFSGRGLAMCKDPAVTYVELDLPQAMADKRSIICAVTTEAGIFPQENLHLESGDALDLESLWHAASHFQSGPIIVVNEGLLRYLTFEEKAQVARNVHALLERYGGVWITPDITLKRILHNERSYKVVAQMTGTDIDNNCFETEDQARTFFEDLGFTIERHSLREVGSLLVSPRRLNLDEKAVEELIGPVVAFVMRNKQSG